MVVVQAMENITVPFRQHKEKVRFLEHLDFSALSPYHIALHDNARKSKWEDQSQEYRHCPLHEKLCLSALHVNNNALISVI